MPVHKPPVVDTDPFTLSGPLWSGQVRPSTPISPNPRPPSTSTDTELDLLPRGSRLGSVSSSLPQLPSPRKASSLAPILKVPSGSLPTTTTPSPRKASSPMQTGSSVLKVPSGSLPTTTTPSPRKASSPMHKSDTPRISDFPDIRYDFRRLSTQFIEDEEGGVAAETPPMATAKPDAV